MRIFVMFGTQDKRFDRLMNAILNPDIVDNHEIYMQLGYTVGIYDKVHYQQYYTEEELLQQIKLADVVITHAGVGSIVSCLKLNKPTIVVPRLGKYKEQNNDHQVQIMKRYLEQGYIIAVEDLALLDQAIEQSKTFKAKPYTADKQGIIDEITSFIKENIKDKKK